MNEVERWQHNLGVVCGVICGLANDSGDVDEEYVDQVLADFGVACEMVGDVPIPLSQAGWDFVRALAQERIVQERIVQGGPTEIVRPLLLVG